MKFQRGGFVIGMVVGLLIGLTLALGVALYVTKAPNPFINKVPPRTSDQDAAEAERNRAWDPNSGLAGRNPAKPPSSTGALSAPAAAPALPSAAAPEPAVAASAPPPARVAARASATAERGAAQASAQRASQPVSTAGGADPFRYFVQAGAYSRTEDAEQQRARLALAGIDSRLTEREQNGQTVFRVRVGPFETRQDADVAKEKLDDAGVEASLVRVQR
jgi:cell division protein FtsN